MYSRMSVRIRTSSSSNAAPSFLDEYYHQGLPSPSSSPYTHHALVSSYAQLSASFPPYAAHIIHTFHTADAGSLSFFILIACAATLLLPFCFHVLLKRNLAHTARRIPPSTITHLCPPSFHSRVFRLLIYSIVLVDII